MYRFILGTLFGIYLEQTYHLPNLKEKLYELDKYLKDHNGLADIKKFWKDHTLVIKRFHRYPHRNKVLGRKSTKEEIEFLKGPNSSW